MLVLLLFSAIVFNPSDKEIDHAVVWVIEGDEGHAVNDSYEISAEWAASLIKRNRSIYKTEFAQVQIAINNYPWGEVPARFLSNPYKGRFTLRILTGNSPSYEGHEPILYLHGLASQEDQTLAFQMSIKVNDTKEFPILPEYFCYGNEKARHLIVKNVGGKPQFDLYFGGAEPPSTSKTDKTKKTKKNPQPEPVEEKISAEATQPVAPPATFPVKNGYF